MKRLVILLLAVAAPFAGAKPYENFDTWCGGGADDLTSTDENWESGSAPDVTANDLLAVFATGGSEALLPAGTAAAFAGIVLDGANLGGNRFTFTAGSGATATIGECALTASNAPSAITWSIRWPITLTDGAQTWNIGENNTVKFDAPIGGDQDLVFAGSGTVELNAANAHSGNLLFDSGTFKITASGALGSSSRAARYYYDRASLAFHGNLTIDSPIDGTYLSSPNATAGGLKIAAGSDVTFNGRVHSSTYMWMTVGPGGMATFENGLGVGANAMLGHLSLDGGGTVVVRNVAADMGGKTMVNGGTTLDVRVAGNRLNAGDAFWTEINDGTLVTRVADAVADGSMVYLGSSGVFDLDGHDQSVSAQHGIAGAKVASSRPATLTILGDQDGNAHDSQYGGAGRTNRTAFVGQVNLTKLGSVQQTLAAASTSTGTLKVASGTLSLVGSWENCTNLVVAGGTFAAKNANAFGDGLRAPGEKPKLEVDVASGASLALDYDGRIDCAEFRVDGERLYGTFGAPGSGADHEYAWISGQGLMRTWGYADWAAANGVPGAWNATDADGVANVFRYAFDKPTGAFANPPLIDLAIEGGDAVVKTPPLVNTAGFAISVVESDDVAGAEVTRRRSPDAGGRAMFAMENAPSRFYRLSATEKREHVGVQLWEGGPYWATTNVGADEPWESGYYFWWGDTAGYTHDGSGWISIQDGAEISFTNSVPANSTYRKTVSALRSSGYIDTTNNLVAAHDAAHVHWGGEWRMPTVGEMDAFVEKCTATWITTNGVAGYLVTGTGEYADRSIFLPAAGYGGGSNLDSPGSSGCYWSSTPLSGNSMGSFYLFLNSGGFGRGNFIRYNGQSVRPVRNAD